jgi:sulfoxide reductase heme-binding subunit YedZ
MRGWIFENFIKGYARPIFFLLSLIPLARLIWLGWLNQLTANPIEFLTRSTGTWALVFLCITLAVTPIRKITGAHWIVRYRRMFGLFCFFYASLHFLIWIGLDHQGDWNAIGKDFVKRTYITLGLATFLLLIPLALTSNSVLQKRLGHYWGKLHRLIYLIAILALLHYWWHKSGKNDYQTVSIYALVITILLSWRIEHYFKRRN